MNCQQFTSFIVEVARGQMMDAATRDGALRHAGSCEACAARLAQEQSLTNALRAVALDMKDLSAPARLEAQLLAAFHESLARPDATAATNATHAPVPLHKKIETRVPLSSRRLAVAITAIAASLVLVVLASLYLRFTQTTPQSSPELAKNSEQPISQASPPAKEPAVTTAPAREPAKESGREAKRGIEDINQRDATARTTVKHARRERTPIMIKAQHVIDGGNAIIEAGEGDSVANGASTAAKPNEAESMTDFISLVADTPAATPLESGQLVRVQVPRAALASLGLPLNAERGNEPVKADVLLGGDGLARAIRFVR
jgi:hypothetical protein